MTAAARLGFLCGFASLMFMSASQAAGPAVDPLALGVRNTEPLPPAEEQRQFRLPPGFEIQLVAAEPDIQKPLNLNFDAIGRLWVTTSVEYPYAVPTNQVGRDRLMILEDFGPDGRARKITRFADGLNIPIGVYPFRTDDTHWKAIVWSIPYIWLLEDTDGDGRADRRTILYGPFDATRDTHGNQASFRRGFDGWLYATHGYNNDSHVTARDGSHVDLNSGNTYRIRLDGSRIEQYTHGQVNPFGLAWDASGNLYSSDCHTAPIYQLLAGGWYPSFGKPNDGLGFAPVMLEHAHGSTAIDGAFYYQDDLWPAEFRNTFLIGNVMTSRLNRDTLSFIGSTPKATEQPDFLVSGDPWFRPVDNHLGPDGALYVADFYNRIIGHYEVPLLHPGRDRERGRIWRVVYSGGQGTPRLRPPALAPTLPGLIAELASPNLPRRLLAMSEIQDRMGSDAIPALEQAYRNATASTGSPGSGSRGPQQIHLLWLLNRLDALPDDVLRSAAAQSDPLVRVHVHRILRERGVHSAVGNAGQDAAASQFVRSLGVPGLRDSDALVQRCAAEVLGAWPSTNNLGPLLAWLPTVPPADTHRLYVARKSLREQLDQPAIMEWVLARSDWSERDLRALADVSVAIQTPNAAAFLLRQVSWLPERGSPSLANALTHGARFAAEPELAGLVRDLRSRFAGQLDSQLALYHAVDRGLQQRGGTPPAVLQQWGRELVRELLDSATPSDWKTAAAEGTPTENPWTFQERQRDDGQTMKALSSLPAGEELTGILRSPDFTAGDSLSFWICGHDGFPGAPAQHRNRILLRESETGRVLQQVEPPRSDVARRITWNTRDVRGRRVFLELIDGNDGDAFAWMAAGDFEGGPSLPAVPPRAATERVAGAATFASRLQMAEIAPRLRDMATGSGDSDTRIAAARGLARLDANSAIAALGPLLTDPSQPPLLRENVGIALIELNSAPARVPVLAAIKAMPYRVQLRWAPPLCASRDGADAFLTAIESGNAPAQLLQQASARGRLMRVNAPDWQSRFERLTRGLQPTDELRLQLILARVQGFQTNTIPASQGFPVFERNCAPCHQIQGRGGLVGPQLTGVGTRGLERLAEDVLDPNRNVDRAFRQTLLSMRDGEVQSGLLRREEGELLVLADATGKEFTVRKADVTERRESDQTLMPDNFGETLSPADFNALMAYLLAQR